MSFNKLSFGFVLATLLTGCNSKPVTTESTTATDSAAQAQATSVSQGEYVARLGNCVACHSTPDGPPLAGGLKMAVPMLGNIYTTNITPDPQHGIGQYTFDEFDRVMRTGVARDGHRLYPAMPYTSYAKMSEQDMQALFKFLKEEVKPSEQANLPDEIKGIRDVRWAMGIWNVLALDDAPYKVDAKKSDGWNRGAYIIQGLGHCGACHTPRGLLMQEKGGDEGDSSFLTGAPLDHWMASPLVGDINSGLGRWEQQDVVEFLKFGHNKYGTAFGTMVEVVNNSTSHMSDTDLQGMAEYLKSLPARAEANATPYVASTAEAEQLKKLDFSKPGARTYYEYCSNCHVTSGAGYPPYQPSLAGNPVVLDKDASSLINLTLNGSLRVFSGRGPDVNNMPYFRQLLTDQQIADALSFVRNSWGNNAGPIMAADVGIIRQATDPTRNDDIYVLRMK